MWELGHVVAGWKQANGQNQDEGPRSPSKAEFEAALERFGVA